jgi:RNA polymerase sigma factor (sigma-70 family)
LNDRSDENLVAASRKGDKTAYAQLVEKYYKQVFLICLGIVGNVHDAEDVAQETILKGFMEISTLRESSRFCPWIIKIARSLCINFVRRRHRGRRILEKKAAQTDGQSGLDYNLQRAIEKLPMEIRLPLVMYYFDGQSVKKVADNLEMSTSAVYSKLRSGIKELHRLLAEQGDENG